MREKYPLRAKSPNLNNSKAINRINWKAMMFMYLGVVINSVLFLILILAFNYIVLQGIFHFSPLLTFITSFFLIVILTPLISKVQIGNNIANKFIRYMDTSWED